MATITLRSAKGSALTNAEVDANFTNLNNAKLETSEVVTTATANKLLKLDSNAALPASITGNAATATALATARTIGMTGDVTWTSSPFGGTAAVTGTATLANSGVTAGTYTKVTVDAKGRATSGTTLAMSDIPELTLEKVPDAWVKKSVRAATTANVTLSGAQTIDGIAVVAGDRVLVKNQTTASQNGIYVVSASTWARSADADTVSELAGACVNVDSGVTQGGFRYDCDLKSTDTLGTTAVSFYRVLDASDATNANTANKLVQRDASGNFSAGTITAALSGNASTATTLQTARTINGSSFNGSANITTANWGTARTLWGNSVDGSANVTGDLTSVGNITGTGAVTLTATSGTLALAATGANVITASTNGAERMRIDSSGNVGIGTSSPSYKLDVISTGGIRVLTSADLSTGGAAFIRFGGSNNAIAGYVGFGGAANTLDMVNTLSGPLTFSTNNTERMRIDSSGNVGIGTSSPASGLEVQGTGVKSRIRATGVSGSAGALELSNATQLFSIASIPGSGGIKFTQEDIAERMRIDSSGGLRVGTTSSQNYAASTETFSCYGSGNAATFKAAGNTYPVMVVTHTLTNTQTYLYFISGTNSTGSISTNGSTTTYGTSSDYRLKENIQPMQNALAVVQQLNPVTYTWKADGSDGQGFIAHELQAVVPDCVTGEKDAVDAEGKPVYQGVDTSFLVATLTKAIQEQQEQINQLKAEVAALKGA